MFKAIIHDTTAITDTTWTPFHCLAIAEITTSGLFQRESNEVELLVQENIELRAAVNDCKAMTPIKTSTVAANSGSQEVVLDTSRSASDWIDRSTHRISITTHRIVFYKCETQYFKSPKLLLSTAIGDVYLVYDKSDGGKLRDDCYKHIKQSLSRKLWEQSIRATTESKARYKSAKSNKVGIDAVLTSTANKQRYEQQLTDTAFHGTDVDTVLKEATELVQIIHKYVAQLDRSSSDSNSKGGGDDDARLVQMLSNMGMTSALNKDDYKGQETAYYDQTARQLADFLLPKLTNKTSGSSSVITLTDVYCIYNRSLGTHLLSPEDLLRSVQRFKFLRVGIELKTFADSGLMVLQPSSITDDILGQQFVDLIQSQLQTPSHDDENKFITVTIVSRAMSISAILAEQQLASVEQNTKSLVRDETYESIRYYENIYFK